MEEYGRWSNFRGKMKLFRNTNEDGKVSFVTTVSNRNEEGKYENMYFPINFKKTIDTTNLGEDIVAEGFITFYKVTVKNENGEEVEVRRPKLVIMDVIDNGVVDKFVSIDDADNLDELPF